jgi:lipoprotein NlpD
LSRLRRFTYGCVWAFRGRLLALIAAVLLLLGGCTATTPAPVFGWNWSGPAPKGYYLVRRGDTLELVSQRLGANFRKLARWNKLQAPYTIYADTLLRVEPPDGARPVRAPGRSGTRGGAHSPNPPDGGSQSAQEFDQVGSDEGPGSRREASGIPWAWPLSGKLLQGFRSGDRTRQGIRIAGRAGEPVRATAPGQVVYSGDGLKGYGNLIIIKHNDKYLSAYGFNRRLHATEGDSVKRGQVVAEVGQGVEGAYLLHFEVRRHGTAVDPLLYLPPRN